MRANGTAYRTSLRYAISHSLIKILLRESSLSSVLNWFNFEVEILSDLFRQVTAPCTVICRGVMDIVNIIFLGKLDLRKVYCMPWPN